MGRWVRIDRRYNQPYRLTSHASRAIFKWTGLVLALVFVNSALAASHLGGLDLATTGGLIWYGVHCARRNRAPQLSGRMLQIGRVAGREEQFNAPVGQWQYNAPPHWPSPPPGWSPESGWQPDPSWPPAPPEWQLWVPGYLTARRAR